MGFRTAYGNTHSENGWPMVDQGSCQWITVPGTDVRLQIQQGQPLAILRAFAADFNTYVEPLRDADSACWTPTNEVGNSNHLSGTGMDLNWNGADGRTFRLGIPESVAYPGDKARKLRELIDFYEGMVFCGGNWDIRDWMHFQLGGNTWNNPKTGDFVKRKIRADGYSTFRRGAVPPSDPDAGGGRPLPRDESAADALSRAMGARLSLDRYRQLLPAVSASLKACECTTVDRIAMWCAQIGHESGGLYYTEEIASGAAYEGRADLGNTQPGDGVRFKGRSWIQITGRSNYTRLSQWAASKGLVPNASFFVDNPAALAADEYAGLGAAWYWVVARPDINALSDRRDLETVTRRINGGTNGIDDRRDRYNRALALGEQLLTLIGGDDLSAEAERMIRELWETYVDRKYPSQSIYATPGEGPRWKLWEQVRNLDGMEHPRYVEDAARLGDFRELARIALVATGRGATTDPYVVARARQFMTELERDNPDMLKAFIAANGVAQ